jgi:hypothetical protein
MGSTFIARRAGINPAIAATIPSNTITMDNETGSVLFNP